MTIPNPMSHKRMYDSELLRNYGRLYLKLRCTRVAATKIRRSTTYRLFTLRSATGFLTEISVSEQQCSQSVLLATTTNRSVRELLLQLLHHLTTEGGVPRHAERASHL